MAAETTFRALFNDVIAGARSIPDLDKEVSQAICDDLNRSKTAISRKYEDINHYMKTTYMEDPLGRLDRHKCAASFIIAVLTCLDLANSKKLKAKKFLRERIAISVGLSVMRTLIHGDNENYKNAGIIALLKENGDFKLPKIICDAKPCLENWAKELYYGIEENKIHPLSLANELFLLESYNLQIVENKALEEEVKTLREKLNEKLA